MSKSTNIWYYILQEKKSDSKTYKWHGVTETFSSPIQLKERLVDDFKDKLPGEFDVGYVAKRGNAKRWIHQAADLTSMCKQLGTSDTITRFAEGLGVSPSSKATLTSNYISQLKSLQELREIGVLSDEEFAEQKRFALDNIRKLNNN